MLKNNSWLEEGIFFIGLLLLCGLIFSPFIPEMGFYWDDLTYSWFNVMEGPAGTARAYAMDRPVLASVYYLSMSLMNTSPLGWQFLSLFFRYLLCLSFYFFQSAIWPNHKLEAKVITAFFLVYPGFQQQWIAFTYFHQFLIFSIYLLSLILSLKIDSAPKIFLPSPRRFPTSSGALPFGDGAPVRPGTPPASIILFCPAAGAR